MAVIVFIARGTVEGEPRVDGSPETVRKMKALGFDVVIEAVAGDLSCIRDGEFEKAGLLPARGA